MGVTRVATDANLLLNDVQAVVCGRLSGDAAGVRQELVGQLVEVFQRLRWLAACRGRLRDVRRLMQVEADTGAASCCTPLVRQVLTKILLQVRSLVRVGGGAQGQGKQ
jgi:hypothetical protein